MSDTPDSPSRFGSWGGLGLAVLLLASSAPGRAETFLVEDATDDDALQSAVTSANASGDTDNTIEFEFSEDTPTIELQDPLPPITPNTLTLDGTGDGLTLDGEGNTILEVREDVRVIDISLQDGTVSISADKTLTLEAPVNKTSTVDIDGDGGLVKEGAGTLILTGDLDYLGDTTITEGVLQITNGPGGNIANEDMLEFNVVGSQTYDGVVSGSGSLTKLGTGELTLGGLNSYEGGTVVTDGTLTLVAVDDGGTRRFSVEGDITIQSDGVLNFAPMMDETFAGNIDGDGVLRKGGAGTLTLTGTNTSTGTLELNLGELRGTSSSIAGDAVLAAGTTLVFDQDFDGTYGGSLSSPIGGTVIKQGTGNLRLAGDNAMFPGVLQIDAGAVTGSVANLPNDIRNDAELVFDQTSDATYGGVVADGPLGNPGAVTKTGGGRLTFSQNQTYTGPTNILGGRLDVNADLASEITVGGSGTLGGTGNVNATVFVDGSIAPGGVTNPGTLEVDRAEFRAGSTLEIEIVDSMGTAVSDQLVADSVDIEDTDGNARVIPVFNNLVLNPDPMMPLRVTIVDSDDLDGIFIEEIDLAFQDVSVQLDDDGDPNVLELVIAQGNLDDPVQTTNQDIVATALQNASDAMVANELDAAIDTLLSSSLSNAEGARVLDTIGPEVASQLNTAQLLLSQRIGDDVQQRIRTVLSGGAAPLFGAVTTTKDILFASAPTRPTRATRFGASSPLRRRRRPRTIVTRGGLRSFEPDTDRLGVGAWLSGFGGFGTLDGDRNAAEADYALGGTSIGLDYRLTRNVLVGVGGGFGITDLDMDDRSADGEATSFHGLAYAGYATPHFHVGVSGRYVSSELETRRRVAFATVSQTAKGDFDGESYGGRIEAGVNVAGVSGLLFQPIAHFDWSRVEQDDYRESGSPAFDLRVDDESIDSQITSLGLRIHGAWALPEDLGSFQPELSARWEHQFGDDDRNATATLLGDASATPIAVRGADTPTDRALVHVGWIVSSYTGLRATLGYTGAFSSEQMEHGGAVSVQYTW